ncbi:MAG: hypothetical protein IK071_03895 [Lachnospiraceae bacterium]|nr:hypothetical protein [Lachnospiraceae bacterium]
MKKEKITIDRKKLIIILSAVLSVVLIAVIVIVILDTLARGKMYLSNETDKNIESMVIYFSDDEGNLVDNLFEGSLAAGEELKIDYGSAIKFTGGAEESYECIILVTFEGEEELQIFDGDFRSDFNGVLRFRFFMKDGNYYLYTKAGIGAFENTDKTDMDTYFTLDFENNEWDWDWDQIL